MSMMLNKPLTSSITLTARSLWGASSEKAYGSWIQMAETGCCVIDRTAVLTCTTVISAGECRITLFQICVLCSSCQDDTMAVHFTEPPLGASALDV